MEIVSYAMGEGAGYEEGYKAGEASSTAYQDGYNAGETAGYASGYASGYSTGYDEGVASVNSIKDLLDMRGTAFNLFYGITADDNETAYEKVSSLLRYTDTENVSNFNNMFNGCKIESFPEFDTHNAVSFSSILVGNEKINSVSIKTYAATNISNAFNGCTNIKTVTIDNDENVEFNMNKAFYNCKALKSVTFTHTPKIYDYTQSLDDVFYNAFLNTSDGETFPYIDTSGATSFNNAFATAASIVQARLLNIPIYNLSNANPSTGLRSIFSNRRIYEIPNLILPSMTESQWNVLFSNKSGLYYFFKDNTALGKLGFTNIQYKLDISVSTLFTRDTLNEIIGNLADLTGSTAKTLVIGSTNLAKLTADDIAVATDKNWTIA